MLGIDQHQADMFSYLSSEQRVRKDHPLRAVRVMTDEILEAMSPLFDAIYAEGGRTSIPPEKLLRAQLLQMLYSVRSERRHRHLPSPRQCLSPWQYLYEPARARAHRSLCRRPSRPRSLFTGAPLRPPPSFEATHRHKQDAELVRYCLGGGLVISRDHNI